MICALIGDQTIRNLNEERLELRLRTLIEQEHVSAFVLGYFGPFERLALRVIRSLTICTLCTRRAAGSGPDGSG